MRDHQSSGLALAREGSAGFGPLFLARLTGPNDRTSGYVGAIDMAFVPSDARGAMMAQSRCRSESMKCFNEMAEQGTFWVVGPKPEEGTLLVHMTPACHDRALRRQGRRQLWPCDGDRVHIAPGCETSIGDGSASGRTSACTTT